MPQGLRRGIDRLGRITRALLVDQADRPQKLGFHLGREQHLQRQHGQTGGLRIDALTPEPGAEGRPRLEIQHTVFLSGQTGERAYALAPNQPHLGIRGQIASALQRQQARLCLLQRRVAQLHAGFGVVRRKQAGIVVTRSASLAQQAVSLRPLDKVNADAFGQSRHFAVRVGKEGLPVKRRIRREQEYLPFIDADTPVLGQAGSHHGTARVERECLHGGRLMALQGPEFRFEGKAAADARGQIAIEIQHPGAGVGPAAGARLFAAKVKGRRQTRIAQCHHGRTEPGRDLPHAFDLALRREGFDP